MNRKALITAIFKAIGLLSSFLAAILAAIAVVYFVWWGIMKILQYTFGLDSFHAYFIAMFTIIGLVMFAGLVQDLYRKEVKNLPEPLEEVTLEEYKEIQKPTKPPQHVCQDCECSKNKSINHPDCAKMRRITNG